MAYRTPLVVRFGDLDPAGIVYYPRYMHFCHVAMEEFFRDVVGIDYPKLLADERIGFPAVHLETDYRRPLRYGDPLEIEVRVTKVGMSSIDWSYRFLHAGIDEPAAESRIVTVCVDMGPFVKTVVPGWLRARLESSES